MEETEINEMETASPSVVHQAGRDFAVALAETPQFKAFERAYEALTKDLEAQKALKAFREKATSLQVMLQLNAVSEAERVGLEQLRQNYISHSSVQTYSAAQADLLSLCQQTAAKISSAIGLNYASVCGPSCCG
jgi:cell fate (sporulation/competence/biofilm development) regulator YlbF (YheA/YmcA/DUF963 family)